MAVGYHTFFESKKQLRRPPFSRVTWYVAGSLCTPAPTNRSIVRCTRPCAGVCIEKKHDPGASHRLHRCTGGHQTDGIGRTWPGAAIRSPGSNTLSRRGSTSPLCVGPGRASSPKPGGAQRTRESPATRRPTSGRRLRRRSQPPMVYVEWLNYSDRTEVRAMPLPRSLANLKREISEKKWAEARQWWGPDLEDEVPHAEEPETRWRGG